MPRTHPPYPAEFKAEAVQLARSGAKALPAWAADLGVSTKALHLRAHQAWQGRELERKGDAWREHRLVFPSAVGTPLTPRNLVRRFQELLRRAALPARRFHDLRHTAASLMFERGLEATTVQRVLGHSSIAVSNDTYLYLMPRAKRRSAEVMDDVLSAPEEDGETLS